MAKQELTQFEILSVAAGSMTDPRTVKRYLAGKKVQETSRIRIKEALDRRAKKGGEKR